MGIDEVAISTADMGIDEVFLSTADMGADEAAILMILVLMMTVNIWLCIYC